MHPAQLCPAGFLAVKLDAKGFSCNRALLKGVILDVTSLIHLEVPTSVTLIDLSAVQLRVVV